MTYFLRVTASLMLAVSLCGCIFYGPPHRHWYLPVYGHPGYYR